MLRPVADWLHVHWPEYLPLEYSGTATGSLILGIALPLMGNLVFGKRRAKARAIRRHADAFLRLLQEAEANNRPISVTLANRKWYVGFVAESPSFRLDEAYFRVLPILSGFRHSETLKVDRTVYYKFAPNMKVNTKDLVVTLPVADVKMASLFDLKLYHDFFNKEDGNEPTVQVEVPAEYDPPETHYS